MTKTLQRLGRRLRAVSVALALAIVLVPAVAAQAQTFNVLYSFTGGLDGGYPYAGLIRDARGNLYGTASYGGDSGYGVVFEVPTTGGEKVFYSFSGGPDGGIPYGSLLRDTKGNLYGTTFWAGADGYGVVFKVLADTGEETVLHNFTGGSDGGYPYAGLTLGPKGAYYGTAFYGGANSAGTVYIVVPNGSTKVLYSFSGDADGGYPFAGLVGGPNLFNGAFAGTTQEGGAYGYGTVFAVNYKTGKETVLSSLNGGTDGGYPVYGYLVRDTKNNLYGTTEIAGGYGYGTVFKVTPQGAFTSIYSFTGGADGGYPVAGLVQDKKGNLYGTTTAGGSNGYGTVFKVTPSGTLTVLHNFNYSTDGGSPFAELVRSPVGNLYGTTFEGGASGYGTVFVWCPPANTCPGGP
jgi:uncharacterized repeat protein (TIGR03803 family)